MGEDYTILRVEARDTWESKYGPMQNYALVIQKVGSPVPVEWWVQLTQKPETPAPKPFGILHGMLQEVERGGKHYRKFKKIDPANGGNRSGGGSGSGGGSAPSAPLDKQQLDYIVQMLEELTGRRDVVHQEQEEASPDFPNPFEGLV